MKKTIKISLQGVVFHVDEDAYDLLKRYLAEITRYYQGSPEADEILQDIEIRIAEIFTERLGGTREVVSLEDVQAVITRLGKPADIFGDEDETSYQDLSPEPGRKRLYRDPENSVLGGVCGGLGAYFDIDPVWFRVFFVLLALGYGIAILIYIILWIALPEAKTASQRLEMRGEPVNIDNIGKSVRDEFGRVKETVRNVPNSAAYRNTRNALQEFFHVLGQILLLLLKIIGVIIAVSLIIAAISILVALGGLLFFRHTWFFTGDFIYPSFYLPELLRLVTAPENVPYIVVSLILSLGIPLLALVYAGIKVIFQIRTHNRALGLTFFVLWLISTVSLSFFIMDIAARFSDRARLSESTILTLPAVDTLFIKAQKENYKNVTEIISMDETRIFRDRETGEILGRPEIDILSSGNAEPELELYRRSRGHNREQAVNHAENIEYTWTLSGKTLTVDPWFTAGEGWSAQRVDIRLRIPEGMVVCLDKSVRNLLDYVPHEDGYSTYNLPGKCWKMTEEGLVRTR